MNLLSEIEKRWNKFFFEPESTATIGLYRICVGLVVFLSVLGKFPFRELFYGPDAIVSMDTVTHYFSNKFIYFLWIPQTETGLTLFFIALLIATASLIVGFQTRISSILVFLGLICLSNRNFFVDNAGDDLLRGNCLVLMFSQAGRAYSLDRWLRVKRGIEKAGELPKCAPWVIRCIQLQLAWLYFDTAKLKLQGGSWVEGTAMHYAMGYLELRRLDFPFLFNQVWKVKMMTYGTLLGEFSLSSLIWIRKFRYYILAIGFMLHEGINLAMQFPVFQYVMMANLVAFIYPEDIEKVLKRLFHWLFHLTAKKKSALSRAPV